MTYITDHGSITTDNVELLGDSHYPAYMHTIPEFSRGVQIWMRLPIMNMADALLTKYPHLTEAGEGKRTGLFIGSGASEWAGTSRCMTDATPDYSSKVGFLGLINISGGALAHRMRIKDYLASDATACVSSLKCIQDAELLMDAGVIEKAVILGWDDQINSCVREVFGRLGASISKEEYENGRVPSAFREGNGGFLVGAGIGYVVLEKETQNPIAKVLGVSTVLQSSSSTIAVCEEGYLKAMNDALSRSGAVDNIAVVKSHGSGTCSNNKAEGGAISQIFGEDPIVTSYKPLIGHTMGASGVIELSMLLDDYKRGYITGIANKEYHPQFINKDTPPKGTTFLANAAGMGGVYSTLVATWLD
jgi:3-oxoacyl-(acyl-carrier-protein) synthase